MTQKLRYSEKMKERKKLNFEEIKKLKELKIIK